MPQYSDIVFLQPHNTERILQETNTIDPQLQMDAWAGLKQGTEPWHLIRSL